MIINVLLQHLPNQLVDNEIQIHIKSVPKSKDHQDSKSRNGKSPNIVKSELFFSEIQDPGVLDKSDLMWNQTPIGKASEQNSQEIEIKSYTQNSDDVDDNKSHEMPNPFLQSNLKMKDSVNSEVVSDQEDFNDFDYSQPSSIINREKQVSHGIQIANYSNIHRRVSLPYNLIKNNTLTDPRAKKHVISSCANSKNNNEIYSNNDNQIPDVELEKSENNPSKVTLKGRERKVKGSLMVSGFSEHDFSAHSKLKNKKTLELELEQFNNSIRQKHLVNQNSQTISNK